MKVVIVSCGFEPHNERLQPHRSLLDIGRQLTLLGHQVALISNSVPGLPDQDTLSDFTVHRVPDVHLFAGQQNPPLLNAITAETPQALLWHISLSSLPHQDLRGRFDIPVLGVLTTPVQGLLQTARLGLPKFRSNPELIANLLAGSLVPGFIIRRAVLRGGLQGVITLSQRTRQHLLEKGVPGGRVWVVPPGIDDAWQDTSLSNGQRLRLRQELGFGSDEFVVTYFGSPAPIRGIETLLKAVECLSGFHPRLRAVLLSRRWSDQWAEQTQSLNRLISQESLKDRVRILDGFLSLDELIRQVAASDAICLPFELLPSDVPLSVLEAMALGKPVVSTNIACIPEFLSDDNGFIASPGSVTKLAQQLRLVLENPDLAERRARRAREYVTTQRTWASMRQALQSCLEEAVKGG